MNRSNYTCVRVYIYTLFWQIDSCIYIARYFVMKILLGITTFYSNQIYQKCTLLCHSPHLYRALSDPHIHQESRGVWKADIHSSLPAIWMDLYHATCISADTVKWHRFCPVPDGNSVCESAIRNGEHHEMGSQIVKDHEGNEQCWYNGDRVT